jgi:transposase
MDVTDEQWAVLEPLIPEPPRSRHRRGTQPPQARQAVAAARVRRSTVYCGGC